MCVLALAVSACGGGGGAGSSPDAIAVPAPVPGTTTQASAGPSRSVVQGTTVMLDGSASTVASGRRLSYAWSFIAPSGHAITGASTVHPSFTADAVGSYTIRLTVSDGLSSSSATVVVTAVAASASISAALVASRVTGIAPLAVFFDATGTTALAISRPFHDLEYQWNFGETGLGNWTQGARANTANRNVDSGPVASHVFEAPGSYTVTLNVTDGSHVGSQTVQVTVTDPNTAVEFAGSKTACVSASGSFAGCPSGASHITASDYASVINGSGNAGVRRFLFNRGESFTASTKATEMHNGPGLIGAYGSGAAPKWVIATGGTGLVLSDSTTPSMADWRIMDIEMDGRSQSSTAGLTAGGGINQLTLLRLNIHDIDVGLQFDISLINYWNSDGIAADRGHGIWDQLAIADTRINRIHSGIDTSAFGSGQAGSGSIGAYISAARFAFTGNNVDAHNGGEHVLRTPYVGRGVVSHNTLAQPAPQKHCFKLHAPGFGDTSSVVGGRYSEKVVVADNSFVGGTAQETVKIAPQNDSSDERVRDVILERNYFLMGPGAAYGLVLQGGVSFVTVRNNIINSSNSASSFPADIYIYGAGAGPAVSTVNIYNNTLYTTSAVFQGVYFNDTGSLINNVAIKNNLVFAPRALNPALLAGTSVASTSSSNNSTPSQMASSPQFGSVPAGTGLQSTDFKPAATSYGVGQGASLPVFSDFFGAGRALGALDLGAVVH